MRKASLEIGIIAALITAAAPAVASDLHAELSALKKQVAAQAAELAKARRENEQLSARLRAIEARLEASAGTATASDKGTAHTACARPNCSSARGNADDLSDRVDAVEATAAVTAAQQQGILDRLARSSRLSGYASVEFSDFDGEVADFGLATLELLIDSSPAPRLSFRSEIELEAGGPGSGSHAETEIEEAWLEYTIAPWLRPRAGVILVPFGRYSTDHFDTVQDLTSRPLMARRVIPSSWSETALGLTGSTPLPLWNGEHEFGLEYELYAINGLTDSLSDTSSRSARGALGGDNNDDKAFVGRIAAVSASHLEVGVSGYYGKYDPDGNDAIAGIGTDWDLRWGPLRVRGEYARLDIDDGLTDTGVAAPGRMEGLYVEPSVTFWPQVFDRAIGAYMTNPTLTAVARWGFAEIADDGDAGTGDNREERLTLGVNLRPADSLVLKFEWQRNTTAREALEHGDADGILASVAASF
ncbi:MAG: hypothetical protein D6760_06010 [Deltaproteobacteria bacterium]|nr:MAG: hypothetical protein D6760_06010 [Deltaproteobacteria bacterium]